MAKSAAAVRCGKFLATQWMARFPGTATNLSPKESFPRSGARSGVHPRRVRSRVRMEAGGRSPGDAERDGDADCRGDSHGSMIRSVPLASGIDEPKTASGLDRRSSPTAMLDIAIRHFHRVDLE
jgi:hypothetical protein